MKKDFDYFINTLKKSIKNWDYFVNWKKVFERKSEIEVDLNTLNYLLGKKDIKNEFDFLFQKDPNIIKVFPILLAVRDKEIIIYDSDLKIDYFFNFKKEISYTKEISLKIFEFLEKTNLINLFKKGGVKNLVDYVFGVEVGLDSNGRKNRGGKIMENIVENNICGFCNKFGFEYLSQANVSKIKNRWNIDVEVDKLDRCFDFAIVNPKNKCLKLVETNFYNGGGSKLKAVCGEFKVLFDDLRKQEIDFIWITDGMGWHSAKRPLEEVYHHNDFIFNLKMLENNILEELRWEN